MKINHLALGFIALFTITASYAAQNDANILRNTREQITRQYILDLQNADYKDIAQLFEKNGMVISTSRGKINAKEFFYSFLPEIISANTKLHQTFISNSDKNRIAARFSFSFKLKDGEIGNGEYVDEFIFTNNSNKLAAVYMFENLKFENETKTQ